MGPHQVSIYIVCYHSINTLCSSENLSSGLNTRLGDEDEEEGFVGLVELPTTLHTRASGAGPSVINRTASTASAAQQPTSASASTSNAVSKPSTVSANASSSKSKQKSRRKPASQRTQASSDQPTEDDEDHERSGGSAGEGDATEGECSVYS